MVRIDYYLTVLSPYVYLAGTRPAEIATRFGRGLRYLPLDGNALFARTGGLALKERHESRKSYRLQELRRQALKAGMPLNPAPAHWPVNPVPASYALIAAQAAKEAGQSEGDLALYLKAITRAIWAEERDISQDEVIRGALSEAGFDPALAERGLWTAADRYEANLEEAVRNGVFGAPFFVVGEEKFWGQDRLDDLALYLDGQL